MKPHILFDLDGTLTDPAEGITNSVRYALEQLERPSLTQKQLESFIGPPLNEGFTAYFPDMDDAEIGQAIVFFRDYFQQEGIWGNKVYPGMAKLLAKLRRQGATLHVATTKPAPLAKRVLDMFSLRRYFTVVKGSPMTHSGLPKAEVIAAVMAQGDFLPADAVMVGDRKHDMIGAKQHAMLSVGVLFGYGGLRELQAAGADHIAADMAELEDILLNRT